LNLVIRSSTGWAWFWLDDLRRTAFSEPMMLPIARLERVRRLSSVGCWVFILLGFAVTDSAPEAPADRGTGKSAAVVWLHGLGDAGNGWRSGIKSAVEKRGLDLAHVAWKFPKAPKQAVTINGGAHMPSWYDIEGFNADAKEDSDGYADSVRRVEKVIGTLLERNPGLRRDRIIVGGFSQGAVIALSVLLRAQYPLAGIVALSGHLPERDLLLERLDEPGLSYNRRGVPVLVCHGTKDTTVKFEWGKLSAKKMKDSGMNVLWKSYPVDHSTTDEEMSNVISFVGELLSDEHLAHGEL